EVADRAALADLATGNDDFTAVKRGVGVLDLEDLTAGRVRTASPLAAQRRVKLITVAAARADGGDMHVQTPGAEQGDTFPSFYPRRTGEEQDFGGRVQSRKRRSRISRAGRPGA